MKKIWKWVVIIPIVIGLAFSIWITIRNGKLKLDEKARLDSVFGNITSSNAQVTAFYTYGTNLNIEGRVSNIKKDNYEGGRLIITDGEDYVKDCKINAKFENNSLVFKMENINDSINLDNLPIGKYYLKLRLKLNNSKEYKYYLFTNNSSCNPIEYYTLTKEGKNNKINIEFQKQNYNNKDYSYISVVVSEGTLPADVYDFVIDPAKGGLDKGEVYGGVNESDLMLDYCKDLKTALEAKGYKVALTRDDTTSANFPTDPYGSTGRIGIACKTKAKYMISLHLNSSGYSSGLEIYVPNNSNISLAETMAENIYNNSDLEFASMARMEKYKLSDGIYMQNFDSESIAKRIQNASSSGYEPYNITTDTSEIYTIREVGGIATNAFMDGRNTAYKKNDYYNSNQGIECYQIYLGSIKGDLEIIQTQKDRIINAIANAF